MSKKRAKSKTDAGSRGVGRPATHPEGNTRIVSATLPSEQVKDLDLIADQKGRSRSEIISQACRQYLVSSKNRKLHR